MKKKYIYFIIIFSTLIISSMILYIFKADDNVNSKSIKISLYTIPERDKIYVNGIITPEKSESIYLDSTKGSVNKVTVTNGQVVKKGNTLFTYKNDSITDQITQLNTQVNTSNNQKIKLIDKQTEAKTLLAKQQAEVSNQAVQSEADSNATIAVSQVTSTEAQISSYQDQIDTLQDQINTYQEQIKNLQEKELTTINAPIDGKVTLNDTAKDSTKPFIVIESTTFYIKGSTNEKDLLKLKENQSADILVFATNKTLTGKVKSIGNRPAGAELSTQAAVSGSSSSISYYDVNISLDSQENITNGFHVQATVNLSEGGIRIPKNSIFEVNGKEYVFKVVDKKLKKQEITCEESAASDVVVNTGIKENDSIATRAKDMKEGMSVE